MPLVLIIAWAIAWTGCGEQAAAPPSASGFVSRIEAVPGGAEPDVLGRIVVESHADKLVRRIVVDVSRRTHLFRAESGRLTPMGFDALRLRDRVQVWIDPPTLRTDETPSSARRIVVIGRP